MPSSLDLLGFGPNGWGGLLLGGALLTLQLAFATLPFGLALGLGVALAKNSPSRWLRLAGNIYTTLFRALPELLTIFLVYIGGTLLLSRLAGIVVPGTRVDINAFIAGMVALALVLGAFSSEVFLGALNGIDRGQIEAGRALGLKRLQGFVLIVLPQLWRLALPGLANSWLVLLKDTSLVSAIGLSDLMRQTQVAVGSTKQPFLFFAATCLIYLCLSLLSTGLGLWLEKRANRGFQVQH